MKITKKRNWLKSMAIAKGRDTSIKATGQTHSVMQGTVRRRRRLGKTQYTWGLIEACPSPRLTGKAES